MFGENGRSGFGFVVMVVLLVAPALAEAHRLDEYLQAAQISISPDGITVDLYLTPGVLVAPAIDAEIDIDGNRAIDEGEAERYASRVLERLRLSLDGADLARRIVARSFPCVDDLERGIGTIHLAMFARVPQHIGSHRVRFENGFDIDNSVFLANALHPDSPRVAVRTQRRDSRQRTLDVDFDVSAPSWIGELAVASAVVIGVAVGLRRRRRSPVDCDG